MASIEHLHETNDFNGKSAEEFLAGHEILQIAQSLDASRRLQLLEDVAAAITYEVFADRTTPEEVDAAIEAIDGTLGHLRRHKETIERELAPRVEDDDPHSR